MKQVTDDRMTTLEVTNLDGVEVAYKLSAPGGYTAATEWDGALWLGTVRTGLDGKLETITTVIPSAF